MDNIRNIYRKINLAMVVVLFIAIFSTYMFFIANIDKGYQEDAVERILDSKKEFLKSTVDNLIVEIKVTQMEEKQYYRKLSDNISQTLGEYYERAPKTYIDLFINFCKGNKNKETLSVSIRDTRSNESLYESGVFIENTPIIEDFYSYAVSIMIIMKYV